MKTQRKLGYVGKIVNGKKLATIANKIYELQYGEKIDFTIDDLLLITLKETDVFGDNKIALVCTEGVGWITDDYNLISVPTNISFGWCNGQVSLSPKVIKSCLTDKEVDIADYIRVFGDRLDSNCYLWQGRMQEVA